MKTTLSLLLALCLIVSAAPCFAAYHGPYGQCIAGGVDFNREVLRDGRFDIKTYPDNSQINDEPLTREIIHTKTIHTKEVLPPRAEPSRGFAVGIHGDIPTLIYGEKMWELEIGYTSINSDARGILKAGINLAGDHEDYTVIHTGITLIEDAGTRLGIYFGAEQYIENSVSITGDVYLTTLGENRMDYLIGVLGARLRI